MLLSGSIFILKITYRLGFDKDHHHHHRHHHHDHVAIKQLGHLLTRSGLTRPQVSSLVFLGSICLLGRSIYQSG
jgi:hypothetical protein